MGTDVNVTTPTSLDDSNPNAVLEITFTNTNAFDYAANSNIYYYAFLTDSTSGTAKTREVTFTIPKTTQGTIAANTTHTFSLENTTNLVPTITPTNGNIYYKAR